MPKSIRAKIALLTGTLSAVILVGLAIFLYSSLRIQLYQSVDDGLRIRADQLLGVIEDETELPSFDPDEYPTLNMREDMARLVSPSGTVLDTRGNDRVPIVSSTIGNGERRFFTIRCTGALDDQDGCEETGAFRLLSVPVVVDGATVAYLQVGRDIEPVQEALARLLRLLLIAGPILVGMAALGGYWLTGQALAPIEKIRRQAAAINAKDMSQRLNLTTTDDEVGRLAQTFNEMLDRLEESFQRQRRFTADASHELRTPLAVIRGEIDVGLERPRTAAEYVETLESVGAEAGRMNRLVNELLLLARADAHELRLDYEKVDLADLLKLLVEQMQRPAQEAEVRLGADLPRSLPILGDRDRLLELFLNLLENTLVHAPGSQVDVRAHPDGEAIVVTITDTGPGIPEEHVPHLFERFYRVDQVRGRSRGGTGLGLALAQEIAHAHGGDISVRSEWGKGTTFSVQLSQKSQNGKSDTN